MPAGAGGASDQMARTIQGIIVKHQLMKQPMLILNMGGRQRRRGPDGRQGFQGQSAQADGGLLRHLHAADRRQPAVQLARPESGGDDRAGRIRAVGQRRNALQDDEGLPGCGEGRAARNLQDGRHRHQARGSHHHRRAGKGRRREVLVHPLHQRRPGGDPAGGQAHRLERQQPEREHRPVARRPGARPVRVLRAAHGVQGQSHHGPGLVRHPDLQGVGRRRRIPDAARLLPAAATPPRSSPRSTPTC